MRKNGECIYILVISVPFSAEKRKLFLVSHLHDSGVLGGIRKANLSKQVSKYMFLKIDLLWSMFKLHNVILWKCYAHGYLVLRHGWLLGNQNGRPSGSLIDIPYLIEAYHFFIIFLWIGVNRGCTDNFAVLKLKIKKMSLIRVWTVFMYVVSKINNVQCNVKTKMNLQNSTAI